MAVRDIVRLGDPRLRVRAAEVPEAMFGGAELRALLQDLRDTMAARDGAGLAAPQIAVPLRVVIYGFTHNPRYPNAAPIPETVLVNPCIEPLGEAREAGWEGCLSVPGLRGEVERWQRIRLHWRDPLGAAHTAEREGFHARVVQHECDHLNGVLFPDRLRDPHAFGFSEELRAAGLL